MMAEFLVSCSRAIVISDKERAGVKGDVRRDKGGENVGADADGAILSAVTSLLFLFTWV